MPRLVSTNTNRAFTLDAARFFRIRLLISDSDQISKLIDGMEQEAMQIKQEALKMCWYMRGGLTYTEAMTIGQQERRAIGKLIKDNLDTTKKSGLPFF
jgi:hypothetical protein